MKAAINAFGALSIALQCPQAASGLRHDWTLRTGLQRVSAQSLSVERTSTHQKIFYEQGIMQSAIFWLREGATVVTYRC